MSSDRSRKEIMNGPPDMTVYNRAPLAIDGGIPVFSASTRYSVNYDKIAADHLQSVAEGSGNPFFRESVWRDLEEATIAQLRKVVRPGARILDVGVGLGRVLGHFPELERYGCDVSLEYLKTTRLKGIDVCCAQIEDNPYAPEAFDVVIATDVLEHVMDLNKAVAAIDAVLKPGGYFVVRVPDREDLHPYVAEDQPYEFIHLRTFDEASLRLLLCRVFDFEWIETAHVCAISSRKIRLPLPLPEPLRRAASGVVYALTARLPRLRKMTAPLLYRPLEVGMILRKRAAVADGDNAVGAAQSARTQAVSVMPGQAGGQVAARISNAQVREFWERNPVAASAIGAAPGTVEFFRTFDAIREADDCEPYEFSDRIHGYSRSAGKRVLDVGCGNGYVLAQYARHGAEVHGVDLTATAVGLSRRRFELAGLKGQFQSTDGNSLPFPDDFFDIACSMGVLHHIEDPRPMLAEMHRVLKPGGKLILMLYHRYSWKYLVILPLRRLFDPRYRGKTQAQAVNMNDGPDCPLAMVYSKREARRLLAKFADLRFRLNQLSWRQLIVWPWLVNRLTPLLPSCSESIFARHFGWNLYIEATKRPVR